MLTPDQIMAESFRIIDAEVGVHPFEALEWQVVRRIIHASGDLELARLTHFQRDAAHAGVQPLQAGVPMVTDVSMVASRIRQPELQAIGVTLHCVIDAPDVAKIVGTVATKFADFMIEIPQIDERSADGPNWLLPTQSSNQY